MMKSKTVGEKIKSEIVENILSSTALKIGKFTVLGLGVTYALGYVFKVLAFTKTNINQFRRTLKP